MLIELCVAATGTIELCVAATGTIERGKVSVEVDGVSMWRVHHPHGTWSLQCVFRVKGFLASGFGFLAFRVSERERKGNGRKCFSSIKIGASTGENGTLLKLLGCSLS
jgi:hypothetical protein